MPFKFLNLSHSETIKFRKWSFSGELKLQINIFDLLCCHFGVATVLELYEKHAEKYPSSSISFHATSIP